MRKSLEQAIVEEYEGAVEPFKTWRPQPDSTSTPKPVAAVLAENAVQMRKSLLAKKDAKRNEEQERGSRNSIPQTRQNPETAENSLAAADKMEERTKFPSFGLTAEHRNEHKSFQSDQQDIETSENPFPKSNEISERTKSPSQQMTERQKDREFVNNDRQSEREFLQSSLQNAGTYENSFFEPSETTEHTEILSRQQLTGHQNTQDRHYSDRQNTVASGNSFPKTDRAMKQSKVPIPEPDGITEYAGIPPRQPTERQDTLEFPSQNWQVSETQVNPSSQIHQVAETQVNSSSQIRQIAETQVNPSSQTQQVVEPHANPSLRTRQNARTSENNPIAEKKTGARERNHDTITVAQHGPDKQTTQDAEARRMEKLNAAYEHDRAALAKTDPAFARSTFRDVGHTEGSEETDGQRQLSKKANRVATIIANRLEEKSEINLI